MYDVLGKNVLLDWEVRQHGMHNAYWCCLFANLVALASGKSLSRSIHFSSNTICGIFYQSYFLCVSKSIPRGLPEMLFPWICCLKFLMEKTLIFSPVLPFMCFHIYSTCIIWYVIHVDLSSKISHRKDMDIFTCFTLHIFPHLFHMDYMRCYSRGFVV